LDGSTLPSPAALGIKTVYGVNLRRKSRIIETKG